MEEGYKGGKEGLRERKGRVWRVRGEVERDDTRGKGRGGKGCKVENERNENYKSQKITIKYFDKLAGHMCNCAIASVHRVFSTYCW